MIAVPDPSIRQGRLTDALSPRLFVLLAGLSGACALGYEVLCLRALTTLLGDRFYVHAALLSTFLIGFGIGAIAARSWWRRLAYIEIANGGYAIALPLMLAAVGQSNGFFVVTGSPILTSLLTSIAVIPPSFLSGFSIPLFSAYLKEVWPEENVFSRVYALYHIGTALSVLVVEFALVRSLGLQYSLITVGIVNISCGILLLLVGTPREPIRVVGKWPDLSRVLTLAVGSFVSALFQMQFFMICYRMLRPHRENFALGLFVIQIGLFLGALLVRIVRPRVSTCLLISSAGIVGTFVFFDGITMLYSYTSPWETGSAALIFSHKLFFACILALVPSIGFAALIPTLVRDTGDLADESGRLLFISCFANAAGYLCYVFFVHEYTTNGSLLAGIVILCLATAVWSRPDRSPKFVGTVAIVCLAAFVMLMRASEDLFYFPNFRDYFLPGINYTVFKEGPDSAVLLEASDYTGVSYTGHTMMPIRVEGRVDAGEIASGIIPALVAPRFDKALVLGLGTGMTAGAAARIFAHTDVVDLNGAFFKMMPRIRFGSLEIDKNPAAHLHLADGRAFLVGKEEEYDAIINSIPTPNYYAAAKIYTREFHARVARALKPDGVFSTWLGARFFSEEGVETILSELHSQFRYCDLSVIGPGYFMVTCSNAPLAPRVFSQLPIHSNLIHLLRHSIAPLDPDEFFKDLRVSSDIFAVYQPPKARANTDDRPILEFLLVRSSEIYRMGDPFFLKNWDKLNIKEPCTSLANDIPRFTRCATTHNLMRSDYFVSFLRPFIERDRQLVEAYNAYRGSLQSLVRW